MEQGHFGDTKSVGPGVMERRIHVGPGYRLYYTRRGETLVILLAGGDKSTQARDIARAVALAAQLKDPR
jgi:putative addiction module killer protein